MTDHLQWQPSPALAFRPLPIEFAESHYSWPQDQSYRAHRESRWSWRERVRLILVIISAVYVAVAFGALIIAGLHVRQHSILVWTSNTCRGPAPEAQAVLYVRAADAPKRQMRRASARFLPPGPSPDC
jgi:hypothetical protein